MESISLLLDLFDGLSAQPFGKDCRRCLAVLGGLLSEFLKLHDGLGDFFKVHHSPGHQIVQVLGKVGLIALVGVRLPLLAVLGKALTDLVKDLLRTGAILGVNWTDLITYSSLLFSVLKGIKPSRFRLTRSRASLRLWRRELVRRSNPAS